MKQTPKNVVSTPLIPSLSHVVNMSLVNFMRNMSHLGLTPASDSRMMVSTGKVTRPDERNRDEDYRQDYHGLDRVSRRGPLC